MEKNKKVLVALSGGVDSSVSAGLLQRDGYEVHGAFIQTWSPPWLPCTWREERRDAMRVSAHLGIPFYTVDLSKEYEEHVVSYMIAEYSKGRTPNPDVMCNTRIKFGGFFDWAMAHGFDYIATGHYAQVKREGETVHLLAGVDKNKDQSYFLWTLTENQLKHTLFPIGHLEKHEVRTVASDFGLLTASKKDSQGICFLGDVDMKQFLEHYIPRNVGDVCTPEGERIGTHDGSMFYTLGQRHGFTVSKKTPNSPPLYIVAKDIDANTLIVAPKPIALSVGSEVVALSKVLLRNGNFKDSLHCDARIRYRQPLFKVELQRAGTLYTVRFMSPQAFVSIGQSIVFYQGDVCLGGGVLE